VELIALPAIAVATMEAGNIMPLRMLVQTCRRCMIEVCRMPVAVMPVI
jgi:hypothetical protein